MKIDHRFAVEVQSEQPTVNLTPEQAQNLLSFALKTGLQAIGMDTAFNITIRPRRIRLKKEVV